MLVFRYFIFTNFPFLNFPFSNFRFYFFILGGAAGGYKSFFNRLAKAHGFENEVDFKGGFRHGEAKKIQSKIVENNLNKHFGCSLPN